MERKGLYLRKSAVKQYILLYFLYGLNGARWFVHFQYGVVLIVIGLYGLFAIQRKSLLSIRMIWFPMFILGAITIVRFISGGIGLDMWELYASQIMIVYLVFHTDQEMALTRYVRFTAVMAIISLGFWIAAQIVPSVLMRMLTVTNSSNYSFYGLWLYTIIPHHIARNTGIFTEPGRYQTVICSAIYLLIFLSENLQMKKREQRNCLIILLITLMTIRSTTGYLSFMIILVGVLLQRGKRENGIGKNSVIVISILMLVYLTFNYWEKGTDSILEKYFFGKIASTDATDKYSSGGARLRSITVCLQALLTRPWGAGITNIVNLMAVNADYASNTAGAGLMTYFAALGIVPTIVTIVWLVKPFFEKREYLQLMVFLGLYINIAFAQTYAFYPALLIIPISFCFQDQQRKSKCFE